MDIKGFVEKAKEAAAAASVKATAATQQAMGAAAATTAKLSEAGAAKIQELIESFQRALPEIRSAGYDLTEFEIELGVAPKLIPHFRYAETGAEDVARAQEALRENKLGSMILSALLKAGEVHGQIKVAGFGFSHVEIELGLVPSVRLQYKNEPEMKLLPAPAPE